MMLMYACNRDNCRYTACPRHPEGHDENIPRIDLTGASQCFFWRVEDDGEITIHPPLKR